jgi:hypothetical protein
MDQATKIATAEKLGRQAFLEGRPAIPALDAQLRERGELLKGLKVGEGVPIMLAWLKGWHKANLSSNRK